MALQQRVCCTANCLVATELPLQLHEQHILLLAYTVAALSAASAALPAASAASQNQLR
jgi:ABC-type lipoprotein release transport system permease subunit